MEDKIITLTAAEESIQNLPRTGEIPITFVRVSPTPKVIKRRINLSKISPIYRQISDDFESTGFDIRLYPMNIVARDYYKLMCKLFHNYDVSDCQSDKVGKPDFLLTSSETQFYIEFKKGNDGARRTQMEWIANNSDKEIWYMFLEEVKVDYG